MADEFAGKVALVTGAASGIGRATARLFARRGASVVAADVRVEEGQQVVDLIKQSGGDATFIRCDVSSALDVEAMVGQAVSHYDRLDIAYNNAGVECKMAAIGDAEETDWDRVLSINLKGIWLCMKHEIPVMVRQGQGAIVNCASVVGLTRAAALEYADSALRVNAVCPAIVETAMLHRYTGGDARLAAELTSQYPTSRLTQADEIAEAVLWLCSDQASYVNGHALVIDGGFSVQ